VPQDFRGGQGLRGRIQVQASKNHLAGATVSSDSAERRVVLGPPVQSPKPGKSVRSAPSGPPPNIRVSEATEIHSSRISPVTPRGQVTSVAATEATLTGASWVSVYEHLDTGITVRHYSRKTLQAYTEWTRKFQTFTESKDPERLSMDDVKAFLSFLAVKKKVAASSQNQAFNALLFLFKHVRAKEFGKVEGVVRAKRTKYIPVVLSRAEVDRVFRCLAYPYDLVVKLLYGGGLRLFECLKLRVQDLNFEMKVLTVHHGKGRKDRTVPLPQVLVPELIAQMETVKRVHREDLAAGYAAPSYPAA